jgi:hypothetical protein
VVAPQALPLQVPGAVIAKVVPGVTSPRVLS